MDFVSKAVLHRHNFQCLTLPRILSFLVLQNCATMKMSNVAHLS